jgi:hypothetical protein
VGELEALADDPAVTLDDLLSLLTRQAVGSVAFVDMVTSSAEDPRLAMVVERVTTALAGRLHHAQAAGLVRADADELFLAAGMIAALLVRTPAAGRPAADAAWSLLRRGLGPPPRQARRSAVVDRGG